MKNKIMAGVALALAFTFFGCDNGGGKDDPTSSSSNGSSSSSVTAAVSSSSSVTAAVSSSSSVTAAVSSSSSVTAAVSSSSSVTATVSSSSSVTVTGGYLSCSEAETVWNDCSLQYRQQFPVLYPACMATCGDDDTCLEGCMTPVLIECFDANDFCGESGSANNDACEEHYMSECDFMDED